MIQTNMRDQFWLALNLQHSKTSYPFHTGTSTTWQIRVQALLYSRNEHNFVNLLYLKKKKRAQALKPHNLNLKPNSLIY